MPENGSIITPSRKFFTKLLGGCACYAHAAGLRSFKIRTILPGYYIMPIMWSVGEKEADNRKRTFKAAYDLFCMLTTHWRST